MAYYLQMDGVNDFLRTPQLTVDKLVIDFEYENNPSSTLAWYVYDNRAGTPSGNYNLFVNNTGVSLTKGSNTTALNVNGESGSASYSVTPNTRYVAELTHTAVTSAADGIEFFVSYALQPTSYTKGRIYDIKLYNGGTLVAHYDMTTQTVQDQSGNGNHATLTGGTWVDDGTGGTPTAHDGISSLAGIGILSAAGTRLVDGGTFLSGFGTAVGISDTLSMFDGIASLTGNGSLSGQGTVLASGVSFLTGNSQFIGTGNLVSIPVTHNGSSSLIGKGQLIGIGVEIIDPNADIVDTIELEGIHNLIVYLDGVRLLTIILEGGLKLKTGQNFFIMSGNSKNIEVTIKDKEGNAVDLTGATVKWLVHSSGTQRVYKDTANGILITDAENGEILISLLSSDTSSLSGEYSHELKIIDSDGKASTVAVGKMNVTKSYLQ